VAPAFAIPAFRTIVRRKEITMLIMLGLLAVFGAARVAYAAIDSLRNLPRTNDDWIWF